MSKSICNDKTSTIVATSFEIFYQNLPSNVYTDGYLRVGHNLTEKTNQWLTFQRS